MKRALPIVAAALAAVLTGCEAESTAPQIAMQPVVSLGAAAEPMFPLSAGDALGEQIMLHYVASIEADMRFAVETGDFVSP